MNRPIGAIPTHYNGTKYRSRTEARWAMVFDLLGLRFQYEAECFDFGDLRYVPDFFMHALDCWIEIKGLSPSTLECEKANRLAVETARQVFVFSGFMSMGDYGIPVNRAWCFAPDELRVDRNGDAWQAGYGIRQPHGNVCVPPLWGFGQCECGIVSIGYEWDTYDRRCTCEYGYCFPGGKVGEAFQAAIAHRFG